MFTMHSSLILYYSFHSQQFPSSQGISISLVSLFLVCKSLRLTGAPYLVMGLKIFTGV